MDPRPQGKPWAALRARPQAPLTPGGTLPQGPTVGAVSEELLSPWPSLTDRISYHLSSWVRPCHPLQSPGASETFPGLLPPPPPRASPGRWLGNGQFCPCRRRQPPALPTRLLLLGTCSGKPSLETQLQSGCGKRWPLLGSNFQRMLRSRVSMGTRAGRPQNPTFTANTAGPQGAGGVRDAPSGTASVFGPPALTNLKSSYRQTCLCFCFFGFFFFSF